MKKSHIGIIIIIIIFIVLGAVLITNMNTHIGTHSKSTIKVPESFTINKTAEHSIVLSNEKSNFTIREVTNGSMKSIIDDYKKKYENDTVEVSSFNVDGIEVKGLNLKINNHSVHTNYYYEKNGIIYHIYPDGDYDMNILDELIKSTNN